MSTAQKGFGVIEIVAVLAVLGLAGWIYTPHLFPGASKRAATSTATTAALVSTANAQGAAAAAAVVKIGEANAQAPESPSRLFIAAEVPVALSRLPSPDPKALIEAERRKAAVMEGRADEARRLYEQAAKTSERLQTERDTALAARRAADLALEQAAAAAHARTVQVIGLAAVASVLFGLWIWAKVNAITPKDLGRIAADIRAGGDPIAALDAELPPWMHPKIAREARLASELPNRPPRRSNLSRD